MTRKEIKKRICELHEQLQKTDFATTIINRQELETRIQKMDYLRRHRSVGAVGVQWL